MAVVVKLTLVLKHEVCAGELLWWEGLAAGFLVKHAVAGPQSADLPGMGTRTHSRLCRHPITAGLHTQHYYATSNRFFYQLNVQADWHSTYGIPLCSRLLHRCDWQDLL